MPLFRFSRTDVNMVAEPKAHQIGRNRQNVTKTGNDWYVNDEGLEYFKYSVFLAAKLNLILSDCAFPNRRDYYYDR